MNWMIMIIDDLFWVIKSHFFHFLKKKTSVPKYIIDDHHIGCYRCRSLKNGMNISELLLSTYIAHCTLHIRVVLSKKLNLHFLFLICSLGYKNKGISSKTCFLNIEKILEEIVWSLFWSQGSKNGIFIV